jgi:hypothetical protein
MRPVIRNLLLFVIILGVIGGLIVLYMYNKKNPDLSKVKADYALQASELVNEFDQDETSASAKYIDKVVEVTGPVATIEITSDSTMNLTLANEDQMSGVICTFHGITNPPSIEIKEGEIITVRGVCSGMLMDVLLNDCVIAK